VCHNAQPENSERRRRLREEKRRNTFLCQQRDVCKAHYATPVRRRGVLRGMEDPAPPVPNNRGICNGFKERQNCPKASCQEPLCCWFLKCFIGIVVSGSPPNVQEVFEVCWREARVWMLCMRLSCRVPSKRANAFPSPQSAIVIACSSRFLGSGRVRGQSYAAHYID
jgi:hypothetical protein